MGRPVVLAAAVLLVGCQPTPPGASSSAAPVEAPEPITAEALGFEGYGPQATGQVAGQPFEQQSAELSPVSLKLQQGEGPLGDLQVTIFLGLSGREMPQNQDWSVEGSAQRHVNDPWILVTYFDTGSGRLSNLRFDGGFDLELRFGRARGLFLPGEINLMIPGPAPTIVKGSFVAEVEDMVITRPAADS